MTKSSNSSGDSFSSQSFEQDNTVSDTDSNFQDDQQSDSSLESIEDLLEATHLTDNNSDSFSDYEDSEYFGLSNEAKRLLDAYNAISCENQDADSNSNSSTDNYDPELNKEREERIWLFFFENRNQKPAIEQLVEYFEHLYTDGFEYT